MEETDFWCVDKNSGKPKVTLIIFAWWWSKVGVGLLCLATLKFAVSQEWIDEMRLFFAC